MVAPRESRRVYMDSDTIKYGEECPECLRWFSPILPGDPCTHCENVGKPPFPNRVRYLAVKNGVSLREISRRSKLEWRTIRRTAQGKSSPFVPTQKKILGALGLPAGKSELCYVFPNARR